MTLSFVVPVKNDAARLERCLRTIVASCPAGSAVEIVVADNGSTDASPAAAARAGARVLDLPGLRVSELRNRAAAAAAGRLLAFVDADHEIAPGWTTAAIDVMADARVGATGALYTAPPAGTWVQRMFGVLRGRTVGRQDAAWLGSGNLVVRREAFERVGGFDATLEACEDVDLCQRLRQAGWPIVADERLVSVHTGDPRTLGALFRAERWRGRDNIRVSLRGPLTWRDVPSLVVPVIELGAALALLAGIVSAWVFWPGVLWLLATTGAVLVGLPALRAARMVRTGGLSSPADLFRAWLVALTYDAARAAALVTRAGHHRGKQAAPASAPAAGPR